MANVIGFGGGNGRVLDKIINNNCFIVGNAVAGGIELREEVDSKRSSVRCSVLSDIIVQTKCKDNTSFIDES